MPYTSFYATQSDTGDTWDVYSELQHENDGGPVDGSHRLVVTVNSRETAWSLARILFADSQAVQS